MRNLAFVLLHVIASAAPANAFWREAKQSRLLRPKYGLAMTILAYCLMIFVFCPLVYANNLSLSNVSITNQSTANSRCNVQFDVSWENSFKDATNYDAVWTFIKYSTDSGTTWKHATLKATTTNPLNDGLGWSYGSNSDVAIVVPIDKKGGFIQRTANATGTYSSTGVKFVWDWGSDKLSNSDTTSISSGTSAGVKVFGMEMVYIPQGTFRVGSGGSGTSEFYAYPTTTSTYQIASEGAITVGTGTGNLYYASSASGGDQTGPIPAGFPKGYNAFYIMKYEISQDQYANFLNVLTSTQASTRYPNQNGNYRHTISGTYPSYSASRPDRACNYLSWADLSAYADWAALRPFTELEFEKACRGTVTPVANEYAWGSTNITRAATISGTETGTETITTSGANCCYYANGTNFSGGDGGQGPLRCGIFATSASTREQAGASYYGVMELSGNVWERPVTIGNTTGRNFDGQNGDGVLDPTGIANVTNWPGTDATGAGFRGGLWLDVATYVRVSDRSYAAGTYGDRAYNYGGRCARIAP